MALAIAIATGWGKWEQHRAETAEAKVSAAEAKIEQQNSAIAATKADGDRRVAEASKGVARATKETKAAQSESARLLELAKSKTPPGACPAGNAVAELRKGLKP